jgi:hypothetical protein
MRSIYKYPAYIKALPAASATPPIQPRFMRESSLASLRVSVSQWLVRKHQAKKTNDALLKVDRQIRRFMYHIVDAKRERCAYKSVMNK